MAKISSLKIGRAYNKKELSEAINEPKASEIQTGLLYCDNRPTTILFVTLDKEKQGDNHKYNDFFTSEYFEWDSQNRQHIEDKRIKDIMSSAVDVHLFARVKAKTKGKTNKFIYCGELDFVDYDPNSNKPIHLTFLSVDFQYETSNSTLRNIYDWKPKGNYRSDNVVNYKKQVSEKRKRTYKEPNQTERKGLVTSRVGQGYYRDLLLQKWGYKCALTGFGNEALLIASHIVPWSQSNDEERLDPENGVLLSPNADALFDKHLISFSNQGEIICSKNINSNDLQILGIDKSMKIAVNREMIPYLEKHRSKLLND